MSKIKDSNTLQAMWIALGSLASFGFTIVSSIILSRYFDKADYGTYKQVLYVYNTLLFVFTLGLPKAFGYFLPRVNLDEGYDLVQKITKLFFAGGAVFSLILFWGASLIADVLNNKNLELAIKIFSPVPFLMLPIMGLESIYSTYRKTYISAIYMIITRVVMLLCVSLPVLLFNLTYLGAISGFVIASCIDFVMAMFLIRMPFKGTKKLKCSISYKEIFTFSIPMLIASTGGIILKATDQFFVSRYYGENVFADFTNGFMELPFIGMIVGATSSVLLPVFSKCIHEKSDPTKIILPVWISVFSKTAMLIYPILVFCWFFSKEIMIILYGERYVDSAIYFQIMQFSNILTVITYGPLMLAIGKVKFFSNVQLYGAIVLIVLEWMCVNTINSPYAIAIISVCCQIGRIIIMFGCISRFFKIPIIKIIPMNVIAKVLLPSIMILSLYKYCINIENCFVDCIVGLFVYVIIFLIYSRFVKLDYISIIKPIILRK